MGKSESRQPWPTFVAFVHTADGDVVEASLTPRKGWKYTKVRLTTNLSALRTILDRLKSGEGIRVTVPDPPTPPRHIVITRSANRGALVAGSQRGKGRQTLIELVTSAVEMHQETKAGREAEEVAKRREEDQLQAAHRRHDERTPSVSLRTVSGGLPTLGRRR
ncbi:hypothetical protein BN159_7899 [Streptomyces davaonensis JCM 4913]|uniref:Uncharacterized protein n=1 Tax=Streptomyces davaonensis (strain DSM 101723 / JCM 4913 / KCC S-0913 / 768) TaxID=1214101 RepID=K4REQ4_STRDJ|nr:hypothetical protein [Streptomyces davaonensis]CCK32278.1 hypothetical protein BN159_7899 [Streptomyces davaonensis JCM 4913]